MSLVILLPMLVVAQTKQLARSQPLALTHVNVIAMTGAKLKPDMTLVIVGNRIVAIGKTGKARVPKGARVIDATGKYLIPGLWDMHVHLGDEDFDKNFNLSLFIANGITGIRLMDGDPAYYAWRKEAESGNLLAPRMVIASETIGLGKLADISPPQTRDEVRKAKQAGADFIKVHDRLSRESYFALVDEAKRLGLPVAGHTPVSMTPEEVSQAGQKSIEHLSGMLPAESDPATATKWFAVLKRNQTWPCPTLIMQHNFARLNDSSLSDDLRLKYVKRSWIEGWSKFTADAKHWPAEEAAKRNETIRKVDALVSAMQKAGVGILAGTDSTNPFVLPGFGLHDELALLVKAGLTPMEALRTATYNPAKVLGLTGSLGTVEKGKLADLVMLDGNPNGNISNVKMIAAVIINGRYLLRESLDEMLAQAATAANKR